MKSVLLTAAVFGLFSFAAPAAQAVPSAEVSSFGSNPAGEESQAAATRVMAVLTSDGLIAGEDAAKLRTELTAIFAKAPATTGDATKDAVAQTKVKERVQAAVVRRVGKEKQARVAELLAKPEAWEAKACAKGKSCCSHK